MSRFFSSPDASLNPTQQRIHRRYEIGMTIIEFLAALAFIIGSLLFLNEDWQTLGVWFFVFGSVCFAVNPTLKLIREIHLAREEKRGAK